MRAHHISESHTHRSEDKCSNISILSQRTFKFDIRPGEYVHIPNEDVGYITELNTNYEYCIAESHPGIICMYCDPRAEMGTSYELEIHGLTHMAEACAPWLMKKFTYRIVT
jgi:hypothetical protein